jgi:hypothetical protein
MKLQFLVETAETLKTYIYENNRKIVPTSATLKVYEPGGESILIDDEAMTIGADGQLSYELTSTHNAYADDDYKAIVTYVLDGDTCYKTLYYDVVNSRLTSVITDDDIALELPQLKDNGWKVHGTAESGTTTTLADSELVRYEDDYFTGGSAHSIDKDETRDISDFDSATGTVTIDAFSSAVSTDKYILTRSYSREIQRAFEKLQEKLIRLGKRPHLILDPYDLREVHIYYSVAEICKGLVTQDKSLWWELWKDYEQKAEETFASINFKYDESEDGYISGGEESSRLNIAKAGRR